MDFNKFTEKAQEALSGSQHLASKLNHPQIDVEHLLLATLDQEQGLASALLSKAGIPVDSLKLKVHRELEKLPRVTSPTGEEQMHMSGRLNRLLLNAQDEAKRLKDDYVSVEHLLLAMIGDNGAAGKTLKEFGVTRDTFMKALQEVRGSQRVTTPTPEATYQAL